MLIFVKEEPDNYYRPNHVDVYIQVYLAWRKGGDFSAYNYFIRRYRNKKTY